MSPETFKGGVHFVVGGLAATMALYNAMRYTESRETHSLVNTVVYGLLFAFEFHQTNRHLGGPC